MHPEIEKLINIAQGGNKITERQKEIILRKAADLGDDVEEVEFILEGLMHPVQKVQESVEQVLESVEDVVDSEVNQTSNTPETKINRKRLFRNKSQARLFGVCAGLADYFGTSPKTIRVFFIAVMFVLFNILLFDGYSLVPIIVVLVLYILAGFVLPDVND